MNDLVCKATRSLKMNKFKLRGEKEDLLLLNDCMTRVRCVDKI